MRRIWKRICCARWPRRRRGCATDAALPLILAGLRQSLTVALIVMVAAELIGARNGLGQLISSSHQLFRVDYMFVGLLTLGAVGFSLDRVFAVILNRLFPWYGRT